MNATDVRDVITDAIVKKYGSDYNIECNCNQLAIEDEETRKTLVTITVTSGIGMEK